MKLFSIFGRNNRTKELEETIDELLLDKDRRESQLRDLNKETAKTILDLRARLHDKHQLH